MHRLGETELAEVFKFLADDLSVFQYVLPNVCRKWRRALPTAHAAAGGRLGIPRSGYWDRGTGAAARFRDLVRLLGATTTRIVLEMPLRFRETPDFRWVIEAAARCGAKLEAVEVPKLDTTTLQTQLHLLNHNPHARDVVARCCRAN